MRKETGIPAGGVFRALAVARRSLGRISNTWQLVITVLTSSNSDSGNSSTNSLQILCIVPSHKFAQIMMAVFCI